MRFARKLALLAVAAVAALAMTAGTATAAVEVEDNNNNGAHCNPCVVHVLGDDIELTSHVFFTESTQYVCDNEYDLTTDENGEGNISNITITDEAGESSPNPCDEVAVCETPWPGHVDHDGAGNEAIVATVCVDTPDVTCEGSLTIDLVETSSGYTATANQAEISGTVCGITGDWSTEGDPVEIVHL